ncbi:MAG: tRNA (cytidine(34)-2'-O)-methyltransferase [Thermodesulfobacteriota bacterium]
MTTPEIETLDRPPEPERHVVLVHPEVHWNTGNIGRTCLGAGAWLHLIKPLGFCLDDRNVKRAGLDYWRRVKLRVWENFESFEDDMALRPEEAAVFAKGADRSFREMALPRRGFLIFGSETRGLPDAVLGRYPKGRYHIPIAGDIRCLNLSTAVGIALYESLREWDYPVHAWAP